MLVNPDKRAVICISLNEPCLLPWMPVAPGAWYNGKRLNAACAKDKPCPTRNVYGVISFNILAGAAIPGCEIKPPSWIGHVIRVKRSLAGIFTLDYPELLIQFVSVDPFLRGKSLHKHKKPQNGALYMPCFGKYFGLGPTNASADAKAFSPPACGETSSTRRCRVLVFRHIQTQT